MNEAKNAAAQQVVPAIYRSIAGVIADISAVKKDKTNKQQGYKFRSIDDVYTVLNPALAKNKVFIVPRILEETREIVGKTQKGANMTHVVCRIKYIFYAEDGSSVECEIIGEGMDTGDKATNKAMAVGYKYACFQVFCIPTEEMDDPDRESPEEEMEKPKNARSKSVAAGQNGSAAETQEKEKSGKKVPDEQNSGEDDATKKITQAMLNTIRKEQEELGVTDEQILKMRTVKAKTMEDLTVQEFKLLMKKFELTRLAKGGAKDE
jgi:hypothetical protein